MKRSKLRARAAPPRRRPLFEVLERRRMLATDFGQIATALNGQLQTVQTALTASLNNYHSGAFSNLPFVGHSLGNAAQIVTRFNSQLQSSLAGLGVRDSFTDSDIQTALASGPLAPFLVDRNGDGVGPDDVVVTRPGNLGGNGFGVEMRLQSPIGAVGGTIKFDTGLPALPMIVADGGTIDVSIGFAFELAFTYDSTNQQVLLDSSKDLNGLAAPDANHPIVAPTHPLAIFVTATLPAGFTANTYVGFIQGTATPLANAPNSLYLTAMVSNLTTTANITLDGTSKLNVQYVGDFAQGAADFPAIDSYIHINWDFHSSNPAADRPVISYDNVYLQLGKFISKVVGPVFKAIQTTTKPMEPVQDILRKPLPGLSDLRHLIQPDQNITLLDLAGVLAQNTNYGPLFDLIHNVGDIVNSIDQIQIDDNVRLPLGGFDLNNYDLRGIAAAGDVHNLSLPNLTDFSINDVQGLGKNINQVIDGLQTTDEAKDLTKKLVAQLNNGYTIKFPIIDDPRQAIFNLLLGKESDLFTLTVDEVVHAEGGQVPSLSVFGMGVEFGGTIDVDAHLQLSYDTLGLREMLDDIASGNTSKIPDDIKDGYYITPDSHFKLSGSLVAGVGVAIGIYSAKVGGFVSTDNSGDDPVSITFDDPNHDGKVRLTELAAGATHTSGRLLGELGIEVGIGVKVLGHFIGLKHRFDIASVVLVDLNEPGPDNPQIPTGPILASQPDATGSIDLYIGAEAGLRQEVDKTDGDEQIIIKHIDSQPNGETVEIGILQRTLIGYEYWVTQTITGVKSISGYGDLGDLTINVLPQVTSAVHFEGGQGKAKLTYSGSGAAYLKAGDEDSELVGGSGSNTLFGGNGNDTLALGSAGNIVGGGLGDNTVIITTPMSQDGLIVGGVAGANNTLVVLAGDGTTSVSATPDANTSLVDLHYQIAGAPPSPGLVLGQFSTFVLSTQDRSTNVTVGDLSGAGVTQVFINEPTAGATGRTVDLDARAGNGPSNLSLLPFVHTYDDPNNPLHIITDNALEFANATTGMMTYLMGMSGADQTTIHQHGGTTFVGQLLHDDGSVTFDNSTRQAGQSEAVTFSTPTLAAGNVILTHDNPADDFVVDAINYPTLSFHGLATQDSATMNVAAPTLSTGANQILLDASTLVGGLTVNAQGGASAMNQVTLLKAGTRAAVTIDGGTSTTNVQLGASRLSDIQHSATVRNAILTIDDSSSLTPDISTLSATAFQWTIPALGFSPTLSVSGLHGILTIRTGAGDQFDVSQTPPGISQLLFNNSQAGVQNAIYALGASSPIVANGNFSIQLGWRLGLDGSVTQLNHLSGLPVSVTLNFSGGPTGDVVLDGDSDPAGAGYLIDGVGNVHVVNLTVGLDVTINGFRGQDQLHIHLPGGSLHANLTQTGPATITVDGGARTSGSNPNAVNDLTVDSRGGNSTLDPAGNDVSVLHLFDILYVASSLPQDNLTLNVPTQTNVANTLTADASQLEGALHVNIANPLAQVLSPFGLTTITLSAVNPLLAVFIIGTDPFPGSANYQVAQTTVNFGTGQLARIQGNVTVNKAVLNINDSTAAQPSNLSLTDTTFSNWVIPGTSLRPALRYSNLYKTLTVYSGAGDRFELDHTPASIEAIVLNNATAAQNEVYSTNWSAPITANGNWSIYLGSMLYLDGTVERIKQLVGLDIPVTLNFSGTPTGHVVLDGDSDPAGAQNTIDGNGNLHTVNQTVGLNVTINGFRDQDQVYVYLSGGTIAADLRHTGPAILTVDGKSRLAGNHPTAPNSISAQVRAGDMSLDPVNTNDSVLQAFNTFFVLGSMPQDSLQVTAPTSFQIAPTLQGTPQTSVGVYTGYFGSQSVVNQPADYYAVLSWPFPVNTGRAEPPILITAQPPTGANSYDTTLVYRYSGPDPHGLPDYAVPVRIFPLTSTPVTTDNNANFDASQLRGSFSFQVAEPDYSTAEALTAAFGSESALPTETFAQTSVVLSKVNPQLSVSITGTMPITSADYDPLNSYLQFGGGVIHYAGTQVTLGTGVLADIQGNVAVHQAWLKEVNDRNGVAVNSITLTAGGLAGWATPAGAHPTLTFGTLQGEITISGSAVDQFDVEGTPDSAPRVTIQNFATSGPAAGVYVMGKTVMPLFVTGNFALSVGRRLNADGTVTNVGQVAGVYDYHNKFNLYGTAPTDLFVQSHIFENLQVFSPNDTMIVPGVTYQTYVADYFFIGQQPLPVFFHYTLPGPGTLVFDASHDVMNQVGSQVHWGTMTFSPSTNYIGVAANANYPGQADLRFFQGDVLYGTNIETFLYGPRLIGNSSSQNKPGPWVLIDNPSTSPVHYIGGAHNAIDAEEILIGAARGPVTVAGAGPGTLVELNPLFSLPISAPTLLRTAEGVFNLYGFPGWTSGNAAGFSLLDTIQADVTVNNASLRVIGDIPLPAGMQPPQTTPDVHVDTGQIAGIAAATIHFSNLLNVTSSSNFAGWGMNDIDLAQLPGLSILLPRHAAAATFIDDTPSGITTAIGSVLSASDTALTAGPISVLKTTGALVLGQFFGSFSSQWPVALGQPVGNLTWSDGLSVPSVTIGSGGSVQNIHGPILLLGDPHNNSPLVTNIDGRADAARPAVNFVAQSYSQAPDGIIASKVAAVASFYFFEELDGFAPATVYFAPYFGGARNMNVYGSAGSSYSIAAAPPTMSLFAGAGSSVVNSSAPISIIGATTVQLVLASFSPIAGYTGTPQIVISEDPVHPQPIDLRVDRTPFGIFPTTPGGKLYLENAGGGLLSLRLNNDDPLFNFDYWSVLYNGAESHLAVSYGPIIVKNTGTAGTVVSTGTQATDVYGTTGPLTINPSGVSFSGVGVRLGQAGNMQAILGEVDILSNASPLAFTTVAFNDSADSTRRTIHLATDASGNTLVSGMAPGLIKLVGARFGLTLTGGIGGSTFRVDTQTSPSFFITGGSATDLLAGPDLPNLWYMYGANTVYLNSNIFAQNIASVVGGSSSDTFNVVAGPLSGNLDGGAGIDTLAYASSAAWHGVPFDLAHGIAPLVGGITSNVEIVPIEMTTGDRTTQAGVAIAPLQLQVLGGLGHFTYAVSGLPPGLSLDPETGLITGTISESAVSGSPYLVQVSANDGFNSASGSFQWIVLPGLTIADPGTQITDPGVQINLSLQISTVYGLPLTMTAQGLPPGLSINSQTGLISGTIAADAASGAPYHITVNATDGTHTASAMFQWNILEHFSIVNPGNILTPEGVPLSVPIQVNNPANVPLTYSASGLPAYLNIDSSTGVISGSIFFYHQYYGRDFVFPVQVFATHGTTTVSTSFNWSTEAGFAPAVPGDQHNRTGDAVFVYAGVANNSSSNPYGHVFSTTVSGLPAGLTFDPATGQITGTIDDNAGSGSPYHTVINIVDQTINYPFQISFQWTVVPTILLGNLGDQTTPIGTSIDVTIPVVRNFGLPITFAASGLPLGLTIDSATGHIHGTVAPQDSSPANLTITISANDGTHDGQVSFLWNVSSTAANVVQLADRIHGGIVTLTSPAGTTLTASLGDPGYYDPANPAAVYQFPIQAIQFQISGLAVGAAAQLTISPPAGHGWDHYLESGPTPANQSAHWHDFLYQHATDGDTAASTGAEFLPSGQIVLHLVDGGRGDDDLAGNGVINSSNAGGPALLGLSAAITGLPTQTWQPGVPITLGAQIGGAAAAGATFAWQVQPFDYRTGYLPTLNSTQASIAFTPGLTSYIRIYYVYLTVTGQDGQSSVSLSKFFYTFDPSLGYSSPPLAHFDFAALPSGIVSGESFGGPINAENSSTYSIADFAGPVSGQITDSSGHQVASLSGAFSNGLFYIPPQVFVNSGAAPATYTISITSGGVSESATFVVHPVTHFVATDNDPIAAGAGQPFDFTLQAEDDRGNVASAYAGSVRLSYTDAGGVHDVGGGLQSTAGGLVTFHHVVLPTQGVYSLQATSADGLIAGAVSITVPLVTRLASTVGDPSTVTVGQSFDFEIVAQDAAGQPVSGYTGILVLTTRGPSGTVLGAAEVIGAADLGRHVFHNLAENAPGAYTLTVSDGVVSSSFALNVVAADPLSAVNTNDDGPGSLRQAILYANSLSGPSHTITFALPPGPQTITLLTPLPAVTNPLTAALDATQNVTVVLSSGTSWNNNSSLTLSGAGTLTLRGGLEGPGNLAVGAGSRLTATHIIDSALVIGGTSTSFGLVTIAPSDASGNPLTTAAFSPSTASLMAAATKNSTNASSPIPIAEAPTTPSASGSALAAKESSSETAGLVARQASSAIPGLSNLANSGYWVSLKSVIFSALIIEAQTASRLARRRVS